MWHQETVERSRGQKLDPFQNRNLPVISFPVESFKQPKG